MSGPQFTLSYVFVLLWVLCQAQQAATQQPSSSVGPPSPAEIPQLQAKAKAGDPDAQLRLGRAYDDGINVPRSDREAAKWYKAAAEQGNATAQDNLGLMFRSGRGVEQDKVEAVKWYSKAARQRNPAAMFNLGTAYYNGDGVGIDDVAAYAWFLLAENFGSQSAVDAVRHMKEEKGNLEADALEKIGDMYDKGDGLPQSRSDAIDWYRKAAENGTASVQIKLSNQLLRLGVDSIYPEVHRLCDKAAKLRYPPGIYCMGLLYQRGWGVSRDPAQAAKWFGEAINMGYPAAMLQLGKMYWNGEGVKQDKIAAYEFVSLAAVFLTEAKEEKEDFAKQMTPKELEKGQDRATKWVREHPPNQPLVLSRRP